jgi:glycosyltransferase involved in cell wall biosynthesis
VSSRPRIVFNALPLDPRGGGVSTYIRELLHALVGEVDADLAAAVRPVGRGELPDGVRPLELAESHGVRRVVAGARGFGPGDLVHGLDVDLPLRRTGLQVATVHDMAIFDVAWAFPRYRVAGERVVLRTALRRADAVIAVSAFTAERVHDLCGRDAVVIHEAPGSAMVPAAAGDVDRVRARYDLPDRFVLHVGNIEPRKDLGTLAEACRIAGVPLVRPWRAVRRWSRRPYPPWRRSWARGRPRSLRATWPVWPARCATSWPTMPGGSSWPSGAPRPCGP